MSWTEDEKGKPLTLGRFLEGVGVIRGALGGVLEALRELGGSQRALARATNALLEGQTRSPLLMPYGDHTLAVVCATAQQQDLLLNLTPDAGGWTAHVDGGVLRIDSEATGARVRSWFAPLVLLELDVPYQDTEALKAWIEAAYKAKCSDIIRK